LISDRAIVVNEEQAQNFLSRLHGGKTNIIPWPVIQSEQFYKLFDQLRKILRRCEFLILRVHASQSKQTEDQSPNSWRVSAEVEDTHGDDQGEQSFHFNLVIHRLIEHFRRMTGSL